MQVLVIRTSAMGDVALTVPVFASLRRQYPDVEFILLTRASFAPLFAPVKGLEMVFPDFRGKHKGVWGLFRLFQTIRHSHRIDRVVDLHDVLRSKFIRTLFRMSGKPVSVIEKDRKAKRKLIRGRSKAQLKHAVERYAEAFSRAGLTIIPEKGPFTGFEGKGPERTDELEGILHIGVAPFARHKLKIWPVEYMVKLLSMIAERHPVRYWLFGGPEETERLRELQARVPDSTLLSDHLRLEEELAFLAGLDLMIAMDSSNMHMASLAGTKVISIWGATDPLAGFGAWNQDEDLSVRIPVSDLNCRPCTVFGKGECYRGDFACMVWLTPEKVFQRLVGLKFI